MRRCIWLWSILVAVYLGFRFWYDGGGGPLTAQEVERYLSVFEERGAEPVRLERMREFLAGDDGGDLVMANFIHFRDEPGASDDLDRYMAHMYPQLFRRACHPVLAGPAAGRALDYWGIENGERWSMIGLVRYRSRRDMMEIATDPAFAEAHRFKQAAMQQTIVVPFEPFIDVANLRWVVGLALVAFGAVLQLVFGAAFRSGRGAS